MRLGLSSFIYRYATSRDPHNTTPMDAATLLRRAYAYGLDVVQFADNLPLHHLDATELQTLQDLAGELDMGIEVGTRGLDRGILDAYVLLALMFHSRALRLVLGESDVARVELELRWLLPRLEDSNLPLAIENHGEMSARQLAALIEGLDHPLLRTCVDTANNLLLVERPSETVAALAGPALQLHLKDYVVLPAPVGYRITGCPLGEGRLDLSETLALLQPAERDLDVFLESWMDPTPEWSQTLLQEEQWIGRCVDRAREALRYPGRVR